MKSLRTVKVKPISSGCILSTLPLKDMFLGLIHGDRSIMYFVGEIISYYGYEETDIDVSEINLDEFLHAQAIEDCGILEKIYKAIAILHWHNANYKKKQVQDFGKIIYLLERYARRRDRFCPKCSDPIPLRFPDLYKLCPICGGNLDNQEFMPTRFRK